MSGVVRGAWCVRGGDARREHERALNEACSVLRVPCSVPRPNTHHAPRTTHRAAHSPHHVPSRTTHHAPR